MTAGTHPPIPVLVTEHMNEIVKNLWVGNLNAASDEERLRAERVRHVVSVLRGSVNLPNSVDQLIIPIDDIPQADILSFLSEAIQFIKNGLKKGEGVLIHCQAGMSRSATVAAAYLMKEEGLSVEQAVETVRSKRSCTLPSETFLDQLDVFQKGGYKVSVKDRSTRAFFRKRVVDDMMNGDGSPPETSYFASVSISNPIEQGSRKLRCGSCRQDLALQEHVLHPSTLLSEPPSPEETTSLSSANTTTTDEHTGCRPQVMNGYEHMNARASAIVVNPACSGYFLEPMDWMKPLFRSGQLGGKITCPNKRCGSKIGNFDWAGQCCGCKDWVVPGFCLTRSKVDDKRIKSKHRKKRTRRDNEEEILVS